MREGIIFLIFDILKKVTQEVVVERNSRDEQE